MSWLAIRMLVGDRAKYFGLVFGVLFSTLLVGQQASLFLGLMRRTGATILDAQEVAVWVMDPAVRHVDEVQPLRDTDLQRVRGVPGVQWAVPLVKGTAVARTADGRVQTTTVIGVDDATLIGIPRRPLVGSLTDLRRPGAVAVSRMGHRYLRPDAPLGVGWELEINDRRALVVAVVDSEVPFNSAATVYTRFRDAVAYTPGQGNETSFVLVKPDSGVAPAVLAQRIAVGTGLQARTRNAFVWQTVRYYLLNTGIPVNFGITVVLGIVVGAAIVGMTFSLFVHDNLRQFAALKAIGVDDRTLLGMVLLQGALVAGTGYGIGIGVAALSLYAGDRAVPDLRGFFLSWQVMAFAAVAILVIVAVAGSVSIRRVMTTDPAEVFRG